MQEAQQKETEIVNTHSDNANFKEKSLEEKKERLERLLEKNPNKIPVIFQKHPNSKIIEGRDLKFISTRNLKINYFANQIRASFSLPAEFALFFSTQSLRIIKSDMLIGELYDSSKDIDGFLYVQYREVEGFGSK